jgi:hypothetical protein
MVSSVVTSWLCVNLSEEYTESFFTAHTLKMEATTTRCNSPQDYHLSINPEDGSGIFMINVCTPSKFYTTQTRTSPIFHITDKTQIMTFINTQAF